MSDAQNKRPPDGEELEGVREIPLDTGGGGGGPIKLIVIAVVLLLVAGVIVGLVLGGGGGTGFDPDDVAWKTYARPVDKKQQIAFKLDDTCPAECTVSWYEILEHNQLKLTQTNPAIVEFDSVATINIGGDAPGCPRGEYSADYQLSRSTVLVNCAQGVLINSRYGVLPPNKEFDPEEAERLMKEAMDRYDGGE